MLDGDGAMLWPMEVAEIIQSLPDWAKTAAGFLALIEAMAIAGATTLRKLDTTGHPLFKFLLWLIGLPPLGVVFLFVIWIAS